MKSDKVCSPRSPDRNRSKVVGSRVSADLREITITKSRPRWCRTVLEGRQDRETREEVWVCAPCVHCGLPCANFSKFIRHAVNAKSGPNSTICIDSRTPSVNSSRISQEPASLATGLRWERSVSRTPTTPSPLLLLGKFEKRDCWFLRLLLFFK